MAALDDLYISIDIESDGPIPGDYSMSSFGAVVAQAPFDRTFYRELKPITDKFVPEAAAVAGLSRDKLQAEGADPAQAMRDFAAWIKEECGRGRRPVAVFFNAPFDWQFINWYFHHFFGQNPLGISGLDVKALYMGASGKRRWSETAKAKIERHLRSSRRHTHHALSDAIEQAELFLNVYAMSLTQHPESARE